MMKLCKYMQNQKPYFEPSTHVNIKHNVVYTMRKKPTKHVTLVVFGHHPHQYHHHHKSSWDLSFSSTMTTHEKPLLNILHTLMKSGLKIAITKFC